MTKSGLIQLVASEANLKRKEAQTVVNIFFNSITVALMQGEKVELRGLGSFRTKKRGSRVGRNPQTGAKVEVPSKTIPYFKPGKEFKKIIDNE
jgi:integration host factor subunit beta